MKIWRTFWSGSLGAMVVKEVRQGMRRGIFVVPFVGIQILSVMAVWLEFESGFASAYTDYTGVLNIFLMMPGTPLFSGLFWLVVGMMCVVIMPLGGLGMMREELEEGNHELLLLTRLTRLEVVGGKFLALWGLIMLTFVSLLPYVMVRYFTGDWDTKRTLALAGTVLVGSGLACALAIGTSSCRTNGGRLALMAVLGGSLFFGGMIPMAFSAGVSNECGFWYHLNVIAVCLSYGSIGIGLARAKLRLTLRFFESKPQRNYVGFVVIMPIVAWVVTAMTGGYFGALGLLPMAWMAWNSDKDARDSAII